MVSRAIMERISSRLPTSEWKDFALTRPTEQHFQDHSRDRPFFSSETGTFQCDRVLHSCQDWKTSEDFDHYPKRSRDQMCTRSRKETPAWLPSPRVLRLLE